MLRVTNLEKNSLAGKEFVVSTGKDAVMQSMSLSVGSRIVCRVVTICEFHYVTAARFSPIFYVVVDRDALDGHQMTAK